MTEEPMKVEDHDFTPPEGTEKPLTDSEASVALAAGDNATFLRWLTEQQQEAARRPDSILEFALQVRMAMVYYNASRTEGPEDQKKHKTEALSILTATNAGLTAELGELSRDWTEAAKRPGREERIKSLRNLAQDIIRLRAEIMR